MSGTGSAQGRGSPGKLRALVARIIARALQWRLVRAYLRFADRRGPSLADSITYRALFSVFAGLLLGFSIAALWLGRNPSAMQALTEALDRVVPGLTEIVDPSRIHAPTSFTVVGIFSLLGLIGAGISAIASLRVALRVLADQLVDDGFFLWVQLRNLLVAIGFGGLLAAAAALSVFSSVGVETVASWFGLSNTWLSDALTRAIGVLLVFAVDAVAVALMFRVLSGVRAPARALWTGALLGAVGLVVLQELSGLFVRGATANPLLASFAALVALLLWFNLSAQVILFASSYIIVATAEARDRVRERYGASTLAQYQRHLAEDLVDGARRKLRAAQHAVHEEREGSTAPHGLEHERERGDHHDGVTAR